MLDDLEVLVNDTVHSKPFLTLQSSRRFFVFETSLNATLFADTGMHTFARLFDKIEISDVINSMFVKQMKMNIRGGPRMGDI